MCISLARSLGLWFSGLDRLVPREAADASASSFYASEAAAEAKGLRPADSSGSFMAVARDRGMRID